MTVDVVGWESHVDREIFLAVGGVEGLEGARLEVGTAAGGGVTVIRVRTTRAGREAAAGGWRTGPCPYGGGRIHSRFTCGVAERAEVVTQTRQVSARAVSPCTCMDFPLAFIV